MRDLTGSEVARPTPGGGGAIQPDVGVDVAALLGRLPVSEENLPVLEEALAGCPELARLLELLHLSDRATAQAVGLLAELNGGIDVEATTGLPFELWLAAAGRRTRTDRRMLSTTARMLRRMPAVATAFDDGRLSWGQVRVVVLICRDLPVEAAGHIDRQLAEKLEVLADADPDEVISLVREAAAAFDGQVHESDPEPMDPDRRFLHAQPRLDGTGAKVFGELDAVGYAIYDAATDPGPATPDHEDRSEARRRADRLVDLLGDTLAEPPETTAGGESESDAAAAEPGGCHGDGAQPGRPRVAPKLLLVAHWDSLLGRDHTPAKVLAGLAGGHLKLPADQARTLLDQHGTLARLLVVDDTGTVVGIGRRSRQPPGWLADATLATHDTCTQPGCRIPATRCDNDHIWDWTAGGPTNLNNLQRLCRHHNRTSMKAGWDITLGHHGTRVWTHQRTGLRIRALPATLQLPPPHRTEARDGNGGGGRGDPPARGDPPGRDPPTRGGPPPPPADHDLPF